MYSTALQNTRDAMQWNTLDIFYCIASRLTDCLTPYTHLCTRVLRLVVLHRFCTQRPTKETCEERLSKETYIYVERPISMKRDLYLYKETHEKRPTGLKTQPWSAWCCRRDVSGKNVKKDLHLWKETYIYEKIPSKRYLHLRFSSWCCRRDISGKNVKKDLHLWKATNTHEKWPISVKRDPFVWKETDERPERIGAALEERPV